MTLRDGDVCVDKEGVVVKITYLNSCSDFCFVGHRVHAAWHKTRPRAYYDKNGRAEYNRSFGIDRIIRSTSTEQYLLEE